MRDMPKSLAERFWAKVQKSDGCWLWTGCVTGPGYGQIAAGDRRRRATHVAWLLETGEWPAPGMGVCHKCDNPQCVRFDHLFLGTQRENLLDCKAKGRLSDHLPPHTSGSRHGMAKLSEALVVEMRHRHFRNGESVAAIARELSMDESGIRAAIKGRAWKHVPMIADG